MPTGIVLTMWIVWALVALTTIVIMGYRSNLTRNEDTQVFLDEAFAHEKAVQGQIAAKLERLQPIVRASLTATGIMSAIVVAYYLYAAYVSLWG